MAQVDSENSTAMPSAAASAGALYFKTDVSPEDLFVAIGRLRREAREEVDRLLQFLDRTDDYISRELEDDGDAEPSLGLQEAFPGQGRGGGGDDREPDLGSFDRMTDQRLSNRQNHLGEERLEVDAEHDLADHEPSLGGLDHYQSQELWAAGGRRDLERDPAESGIGDHDGLHEQAGTNDWQMGGMA
ncbi:hypothetical protein [Bradyrhizobium sp. 6(2017)]|uniref:hypothetical protein n=1 Tax=Bradyrhizobium sp. 6(2017) TaxID=1197460 RepID=UPI0013E1E850|nr:hypothetical protein [Bradyrhizobium sp. 6(2017)]QIG92272.1 hypothetical protein G6P99_06985 [Bradyrhizobium sp. 6(2017)]